MASDFFDSSKTDLETILLAIKAGKKQLPDFQREWVWDDAHVQSLISSVSVSYPIGAIMLLETGNPEINFSPRTFHGVDLKEEVCPEELVLDGQQRLTALYQALLSDKPVKTNEKTKPYRWYYIDIAKALSDEIDRDDAIFSLPDDKILRFFGTKEVQDFSNPEKEYELGLFPCNQIFDVAQWRRGFSEYWNHDPEKNRQFNDFEKKVIESFKKYQLPYIKLTKTTPKEAVCQVFEKVNTGGVSLTVFELMTATYAADNFNLQDDWKKIKVRLKHYQVLSKLENTDYLQIIALLSTYDRKRNFSESSISCKRKDILKLSLDEYQRWSSVVYDKLDEVSKFLYEQKVFRAEDVSYRTQLVPLTAIMCVLDKKAEGLGVREKIAEWYWCGVFGELYGSSIETRFAKDLPEVINWINLGIDVPTTIKDSRFSEDRLLTLKTRGSAAYKGLYAILMREGSLDFRTGKPIDQQIYFDEKIDIHHIFPKDYCSEQGINTDLVDSIINKTPLSARTNRMIGGKAPSNYLKVLEKGAQLDSDHMDNILRSHVISPEYLRLDDFDNFFKDRKKTLIEKIERATGKVIVVESR